MVTRHKIWRTVSIAGIVIFLVSITFSAHATTSKVGAEQLRESSVPYDPASGFATEDDRIPWAILPVNVRQAVSEQYIRRLSADVDDKIAKHKLSEALYQQQQKQATPIQVLVFVIVVTGLLLSCLQFAKTVLLTRNLKEAVGDQAVSEFKASLEGIELKSGVMGLVILAMSLAFFYLYLQYVYNIG